MTPLGTALTHCWLINNFPFIDFYFKKCKILTSKPFYYLFLSLAHLYTILPEEVVTFFRFPFPSRFLCNCDSCCSDLSFSSLSLYVFKFEMAFEGALTRGLSFVCAWTGTLLSLN